MTTLMILVANSDGVVGRCDAKCYSATGPECDCICGGQNHGVGLQRALANTAAMIDLTGDLRERMLAMGGDRVEVLPELPLESA
jgi:hypothetical protein